MKPPRWAFQEAGWPLSCTCYLPPDTSFLCPTHLPRWCALLGAARPRRCFYCSRGPSDRPAPRCPAHTPEAGLSLSSSAKLAGSPQENVANARALFLFFEEIHSGWVIWGNKMEYFLLKWWRPWFCTVHVSNETETRLEIPTFIQESREFPNSPEVRTWHFHCRGSGLIPGQGTKIPQALPCDQEKKV